MDGAKNQISDIEYKAAKRTSNQNNKKKKESKTTRIVKSASGTTSRGPTFTS